MIHFSDVSYPMHGVTKAGGPSDILTAGSGSFAADMTVISRARMRNVIQ